MSAPSLAQLSGVALAPLHPRPTSAAAPVVGRVAWFQARDVVRSRWLAAYGMFFLVVTGGLLRFAGGDARAILSLASIVLYVVPLVTLVFGTVYLYNAREFIELLLAQPVNRRGLFFGLYGGLAIPLVLAGAAGMAAPFLVRGFHDQTQGAMLAALLAAGAALTLIFTAIAFCLALWCEDRLRGLGAAIGVWMLGAVVYDGLVMALAAAFSDYPLERPMLALTLANPIDLARVILLLQLDISALLGYTGAVLHEFLGGALGTLVAAGALALWIVGPIALGLRAFGRKDF
jgi:Cu-processing system permease protein